MLFYDSLSSHSIHVLPHQSIRIEYPRDTIPILTQITQGLRMALWAYRYSVPPRFWEEMDTTIDLPTEFYGGKFVETPDAYSIATQLNQEGEYRGQTVKPDSLFLSTELFNMVTMNAANASPSRYWVADRLSTPTPEIPQVFHLRFCQMNHNPQRAGTMLTHMSYVFVRYRPFHPTRDQDTWLVQFPFPLARPDLQFREFGLSVMESPQRTISRWLMRDSSIHGGTNEVFGYPESYFHPLRNLGADNNREFSTPYIPDWKSLHPFTSPNFDTYLDFNPMLQDGLDLLAGSRDNPDDLAQWLVFADWLDERGLEPEYTQTIRFLFQEDTYELPDEEGV